MNLVSEGISNIKAFALPLGINRAGEDIKQPCSAIVKWKSAWNDKFYQVYVDGKYAGSTTGTEQRMMIIQLPMSVKKAVVIEIYAVEASMADVDLSEELPEELYNRRNIKLSLLRSQSLPLNGEVLMYSNGGDGDIDYEKPIQTKRIWSLWQDKAGLGLSRFGCSDFGYDGAAAIGFGKGIFGEGEFGFDADAMVMASKQLETGRYKFAVKIKDGYGNICEETVETEEIVNIEEAVPAEEIKVLSFDKEENILKLQVV